VGGPVGDLDLGNMSENAPQLPQFDPTNPALQTPRLRPVRGFPAQVGEQVALGLADAKQISDKIVMLAPAAQFILPLLDGTRNIDQIVTEVGRGLNREVMQQIVMQLEDACLLYSPRFDALVAKMRTDFDSNPILPPASTVAFTDALVLQELGEEGFGKASDEQKAELGATKLREAMDEWIGKALETAENPAFDTLPKAVVAPHLDYPRGWMNYAAIYGRMRVCERPDRVLVLGTNHFGEGTGVVGCNKGYQTPLGVCELDTAMSQELQKRLGDKLFEHRFDHEREHSIELHIPWIQHCFGADEQGNFPKVFGALIHDPAVNSGESYDGKGIALQTFVDAVREALKSLPGKTLVVSSADLSHVGPAFGDQQALAGEGSEPEQFRNRVFQHDRELLNMVRERKADELVAAMAWQQNPTRWCSTGNLIATMKVVDPQDVQILNYAAAMDQQGVGMVSSVAMVMN